MQGRTLLSLRGITKRYDEIVATDGVDLEVRRGEFITLLGPSGSGKTTLLNTIAGFVKPDEGRVLLAGTDITDVPPHKRDLNTVFQGYALFPHLNVAKNVAFGLRMKGVPKGEIGPRVSEALRMVEMSAMADRGIEKLSGGQQQRVALARALVNRPQLVLLDEPLSALDAKLRKSMQVELKRIQEESGATFVYVTHDQEEALVMSDRVCVLNDGHIEQLGQPDELYHRPRTRFVAGFIGRNNFIPGTVDSNGRRFVFESGRSIPVDPGDSDGAAVLAVRPERLKVTMGASEDAVPARVIRNRFLGDRIEMDLQIEDGPVVSLYENGTAVGSSDEVYVLFPQEHCHVLPPE
ncbi:MAG: ABC transporter ATP-binding protein [Solirubrobacterales bacterium]